MFPILREAGLKGDAEQKSFGAWAFGESWEEENIARIPERWNARHGGLFVVRDSDERMPTFRKMVEAWRTINSFEHSLRFEVSAANLAEKGGIDKAPWEVLMEYVIRLEKRVQELEKISIPPS